MATWKPGTKVVMTDVCGLSRANLEALGFEIGSSVFTVASQKGMHGRVMLKEIELSAARAFYSGFEGFASNKLVLANPEPPAPVIYQVGVKFKDTTYKTYHYMCDQKLKRGTVVVVDTPSKGMECVEVVSCVILRKNKTKATKWIAAIPDFSQYEGRKKQAELSALYDETETLQKQLKMKLERMNELCKDLEV